MSEDLDPLVLDLVEWVARESRTYKEVLDAWRTSCPRLTVWEDAVDRGFLTRKFAAGQEVLVEVTTSGREFLAANNRGTARSEQGGSRPAAMSVG